VDCWNTPIKSSGFAGFRFSKKLPDDDAVHLPSTKLLKTAPAVASRDCMTCHCAARRSAPASPWRARDSLALRAPYLRQGRLTPAPAIATLKPPLRCGPAVWLPNVRPPNVTRLRPTGGGQHQKSE
jgi:hypothetical protein